MMSMPDFRTYPGAQTMRARVTVAENRLNIQLCKREGGNKQVSATTVHCTTRVYRSTTKRITPLHNSGRVHK